MNPQDPLANLHPLREPPAIGWWPPAPGWWLLAALLLAGLLALGWLLVRRYRANAYRRRALAQLERLLSAYRREQDDLQYLAQVNALLKSVALLAYPRREIAAASGTEWLDFLNQSLPEDKQFPAGFETGAYQKTPPAIAVEQLNDVAAAWIRRHRVTP